MAVGQTISQGVIDPAELYTLEAIKARLGIGDSICGPHGGRALRFTTCTIAASFTART